MLCLSQPVPGVQIVGTAQRDQYSLNAEYFAPYLVSERLGKARSFFHSFVLNILEPSSF